MAGNKTLRTWSQALSANMHGATILPRTVARWASGEIRRSEFQKATFGSNWLPIGQARRSSGTGWVHRFPSACSELANCEALELIVT